MDQRQLDEFTERADALTMKMLGQIERQFEETRQIANRPWWVPVAVAVPVTIALMGFGAALALLFR
ncbi:hypothetical protein [Paraburkholderia sp. J76]|uniref:hypothetical protein n=1 Tax=Paraburkholderia sp. J76 TaxID=2805439 RepID=UPI002ABE4FB7|nr:hypothetical protein [Paraburkholderia sp. J76]